MCRDGREKFGEFGFLVVPGLLASSEVEALQGRFPLLFRGAFETGNYPDEWHWREGISSEAATRHMANCWKSDLTIARLVLSQEIARAAAILCGWDAIRLGQDTIWWKPPGTGAIAHHQDSSFMSFLDPPDTVTCWITLDDARPGAGALEYVPGSHRWPLTPLPGQFHAPDDFRAQMRHASLWAEVVPPDPVLISVTAGSCTFHSGRTWHGSEPNTSSTLTRRSVAIHFLRGDARFSDRPGGYIYRRYKRAGEARLDDNFFPLLWSSDGRRSEWIDDYCRGDRPLGGHC